MPPKKTYPKREPPARDDPCMLLYGPRNNIIAWREAMEEKCVEKYGMSGTFFSTNQIYPIPHLREEDWHPFPEMLEPDVDSDSESGSSSELTGVTDVAIAPVPEGAVGAAVAPPAAQPAAPPGAPIAAPITDGPNAEQRALIAKMHGNAVDSRRRKIEEQELNLTKMWPLVYGCMSPQSQAKVKEFPGYEVAKSTRNVIKLWEYIRKSHLTHMYGATDNMRAVNVNDQKMKFNNMRQGDREYVSDFKTRYDNQLKANEGVGIVADDESLVAIDFLSKLDPKRFTSMLTVLRNNAAINVSSYPTTLAGAYRTASTWTSDGLTPFSREHHSAFVVEKAQEKTKPSKPPGGRAKKSSSSESIECFVCGLFGHYARDCANRKTKEPKELTLVVHSEHVDEDASSNDEYEKEAAYVTTTETALFARHNLLLDTQSSANIIAAAELLTEIKRTPNGIVLKGVDKESDGIAVDMVGQFGEIGTVYYCPQASANILSFAAMSDAGADIRFEQSIGRFTLKPKGSSNIYSFCREDVEGSEGRFYVCDTRTMIGKKATIHRNHEGALVTTVADNMKKYTHREVESACKARELLARMGYPSVENAIAMIKGGDNFGVTEMDFRVADAIWGGDITSMRGKTKKRATPSADVRIAARVVQQQQVLSVDIMFVESIPSLVAVSSPLDLVLAVSLKTADMAKPQRTAVTVKNGLDEILGTLRSKGFDVILIMSDGEAAIGKLKPYLLALGIEIDISGAGGHVAKVERKIQMIKERIRCHMTGRLPFTLTGLGITMLILFCVSRLNFQFSGTREGLCPREAFSGRRVDGKTDFKVGFGDYALCTVPETNNRMGSRVIDCYAVLPTGNRTGTVKFYDIHNKTIISRDQFKIRPMPESVIQTLNAQAFAEGRKINSSHMHVFDELLNSRKLSTSNMPTFFTPSQTDYPPQPKDGNLIQHNPLFQPTAQNQGGVQADSQIVIPHDEPGGGPQNIPGMGLGAGNQFSTLPNDDEGSDQEQDMVYDDAADSGIQEDLMPPLSPFSPSSLFNHSRDRGHRALSVMTTDMSTGPLLSGVNTVIDILEQRKRNTSVMSSGNISVRDALRTKGDDARKVILKELQQMLTLKVITPVHRARLSEHQRRAIIRSSMFLKAKYLPDGSFDKLKARLVAGGDQQDKSLYEELSSATVSTSSVFTLASIAAHEKRGVAVVDIAGAFLNAVMDQKIPVHMRLDRVMADFLITLDSSYQAFQDERGGLTVRLEKALYGCVESSSLWYENLRTTMVGMGYKRNEMDICVFNRRDSKGVQCTVAVHVDDLLIMSTSPTMIEELTTGLKTRYGDITLKHGPIVNYLGMVLDFSRPGEASVTMGGYIDEMLKNSGVVGTARTPSTDGLFEIRETARPVPEEVRVWFHSLVASVLYVAKRTKPECLVTVSALATKVHSCDSDDIDKVIRLVKYIRGTKDTGIVLRPGVSGIRVHLYVDASYGVHADRRSHTGSCVVIGDVGAVHCKSSRQQIVTKSSTEAELVGLSDSANQGLFIRNFLTLQGYKMPAVTVFQDNMSCMALVARGRSGGERTRHIGIRYFWIKDRVTRGEAEIVHKGTSEMYANVLTKPLQGSQFRYERACLTGWPAGDGSSGVTESKTVKWAEPIEKRLKEKKM